jgi:hypothetical protein
MQVYLKYLILYYNKKVYIDVTYIIYLFSVAAYAIPGRYMYYFVFCYISKSYVHSTPS